MISSETGEVYHNMTLLFLQSNRERSSQAGIKTAISLVTLLLKQLPVAIIQMHHLVFDGKLFK